MVKAGTIEIAGKNAGRLENDYLRFSVINETGHVAELASKRTGHENLWVTGYGIEKNTGFWGINMPFIGPVAGDPAVAPVKNGASLCFCAVDGKLEQTVQYILCENTSRVRIVITLSNKSDSPVHAPDMRPMYHLNVASQAEVSGILSHGPQYNSMTVPDSRHHFYVGREVQWPGEEYWEGHEAGEDFFEPFMVREAVWLRPGWFAVLDQAAEEGFAVHFSHKPSFVRSWMAGYIFSYTMDIQHDMAVEKLEPGETAVFEMDWILFRGLKRVDYVGQGVVAGIDLCRSLLLDEEQVITLKTVSSEEEVKFTGHVTIGGDKVEIDEDVQADLHGVADSRSWVYRTGPYRDRMEFIWYYVSKKHGDVGRPMPYINLLIDGQPVQRKFGPSHDTEEVYGQVNECINEIGNKGCNGSESREYLAALLAVKHEVDGIRHEETNPDRLYELCDWAREIMRWWKNGKDCTLFGKQMARSALTAEPVRIWMEKQRNEVAALGDADFELGKPGRRAYMQSNYLSTNAVRAAMIYAAMDDRVCGNAAVRALMVFASDHKKHVLTGAGNILHMSLTLPPLIVAYDLVRDLLTLEEETDILSYFFWLGTYMEQFVNAKGDNDEIHESGCIAWMSGRFPYIPGSERRIMRARAVLTRQMRVVNEDGGWPESPNYANQVMQAYLNHAVLFERIGKSIAGDFGGRSIRMMLDWLMRILAPSYQVPRLGDGIVQRPNPDMFRLAAYLYRDGRYLLMAEDLPDIGPLVSSNPLSWLCYPVGIKPQEIRYPASDILPHTGYMILRSGSDTDAQFFISDYGPYKPGHGHMDKLSFELYAFGENLIGDTGYGFGGTEHHNLVVVDGKTQGRINGRLPFFESCGDTDCAVMEAEVEPGVIHRREVFCQRGKFFIIHDNISSQDTHEYSWRMHFDGTASMDGDSAVYNAPGGASIALYAAGPVPLGMEEAKTVVYSEDKGLGSRPVSRVKMDAHAANTCFTCLLLPFRGTRPEVEFRVDAACGKTTVHVMLDGEPYTVDMRT